MSWNGSEKRRFVRADFPCKITIHTPQAHIVTSHTENIGAGGIRIIIEEKIDIFSVVDLKIYLDDKPISSKARIVWVVERRPPLGHKASMFDTGIEFYQINEKDRNTIRKLVETIISDNSSGANDDFRKD